MGPAHAAVLLSVLRLCRAAYPLVIGAGLSRTATEGVSNALNYLGYGPTYHMAEVLGFHGSNATAYAHGHIDLWSQAMDGPPDLDYIFENYNSGQDAPLTQFFPEIHAKYPDAKVILTEHPGGGHFWHLAFRRGMLCHFIHGGTWLGWLRSTRFFVFFFPFQGKVFKMVEAMDRAGTRALGSSFPEGHNYKRACLDEKYAIRMYEAWHKMVVDSTPPDKLLVLMIGRDGWAELCEFLGEPIPKIHFPKVSTVADWSFQTRVVWLEVIMVYVVLPLPFLIGALIWYCGCCSTSSEHGHSE